MLPIMLRHYFRHFRHAYFAIYADCHAIAMPCYASHARFFIFQPRYAFLYRHDYRPSPVTTTFAYAAAFSLR